jgi:phosphodiesterase/alkaline phosphatase D-like protein
MIARETVERLSRRVVAASLAALAGGLALASGPALASDSYPAVPNAFFGAAGSGAGQLSGPVGVAVDESSGDVYVADAGNNRVEEFDAKGKYVATIIGAETPAGSFADPSGVAVDNSSSPATGDLYVMDAGHQVIDVFEFSGKYLSQIKGTPSSFEGQLNGVTVDASGDLWVHESSGDVDEFSDTGSFLKHLKPTGGEIRPEAPFGPDIAVDVRGDIYASFYGAYMLKLNGAGEELVYWPVGGVVSAIAVDGASNDVFTDVSGSVDQFGPFGEPHGTVVQAFGEGSIASSEGIAVDGKTGTVYASEREADKVAIFEFAQYPAVMTGAPSEVKQTTTKLEGVVNPEGDAVTSCEFEYGSSGAYGHIAPCVPATVGSGSNPVAVSAEVSGLTAATKYQYRLVAGNTNGLNAGGNGAFTTPVAVEGVRTLAASEVLGTSATFNGSLEPNGFDTHYWFEYGPQSLFGSSTTHQDAGEASGEKLVNLPVTGLEPNTTYYYRLAAENVFGVTFGGEEAFTTETITPVLSPPLPVSAITRVTATITAGINPEKSFTTWRVLYGETSAYGEHTPELLIGEGFGERPVRFGLEGLRPDTTYHYAVQATNQAGTVAGPDEAFTTAPPTPPGAVTGGASSISLTTATVAGTIEAEGLPTSFVLEFGTGSEYGTSIPGEAGASAEPLQITVPLQYLAPGTTYHYRFVAVNSDGRTYGADQTFTTPVYSNPIVLPSTLPLIATPAIAFPTETAPTQEAATKKKTSKKKHRKGKGKGHGKRTKPGRSHKHG